MWAFRGVWAEIRCGKALFRICDTFEQLDMIFEFIGKPRNPAYSQVLQDQFQANRVLPLPVPVTTTTRVVVARAF